jgi:hypothetical protein
LKKVEGDGWAGGREGGLGLLRPRLQQGDSLRQVADGTLLA